MSFELFNTSAPRGLHPGTSGFCTVAMTTGLPPALEQRLALLSGYRSLGAGADGESIDSPVAWSHLKLPMGSTTFSVLSRVGDTGVDYSGRSNRLAYHLVLERSEQSPAGPAWLLRHSDLMQSTWDGSPRLLEERRPIPQDPRPASACVAWEAATGDAGWAGVLAQHFLDHPDQVANLVFRPGLEVLLLFDEAMALLPRALRWDVTFSTYFTDAPAGVNCAWRGCALGSRSASDALHGAPGSLLLDLTRAMPAAPDTPVAHAARRGEVLPLPVSEIPLARMARPVAAPERESGIIATPNRELPSTEPIPRSPAVGASSVSATAGSDEPPSLPSPDPALARQLPAPRRWINRARSSPWAPVAVALVFVGSTVSIAIQQRRVEMRSAAMARNIAALQNSLAIANSASNAPPPEETTSPTSQSVIADRDAMQAQIDRLEAENRNLRSQIVNKFVASTATQPADSADASQPATSEPAGRVAESAEVLRLREQLAISESALASLRQKQESPETQSAGGADAHDASTSDVLDDGVMLWRGGSGAPPADHIALVHPPGAPAGLSLVVTSQRLIHLRDSSTGLDVAGIILLGDRVEFRWIKKRHVLDIPGAAAWLSGSAVIIRSGKWILAQRSLVAPAAIAFNLSDNSTALPATRAGWSSLLAFDVPPPVPEGWRAIISDDSQLVTFQSTSDTAVTFNVSLDNSTPIVSLKTNLGQRAQALAGKPDAAHLLEAIPRIRLVLLEPTTRVIRCEIVIFNGDPAPPR